MSWYERRNKNQSNIFYIGEQDYYLPKDKDYKRFPAASLADDLKAMKTLIPTHIPFGGTMGALRAIDPKVIQKLL